MHKPLVVLAVLLMSPTLATAQLKVIISGGFSSAYEQLLPEFERTAGIKVTTGSGASQGTGPQTIAADLAVMPVSEILRAPGVEFAGTIPSEIQLVQVFSAAIVAGAKEPGAARRLIDFLASAQAAAAIRKYGMEPLGKRGN